MDLLKQVLKKPATAYMGRHRVPRQNRNEKTTQLCVAVRLEEEHHERLRDNQCRREPARSRTGSTATPDPQKKQMGRRAALTCAAVGLSVDLATSSSVTAGPSAATTGRHVPAGGSTGGSVSGAAGSKARSAPSTGGAAGTVDSVSGSTFTLTTSAGQKVTIDETSSTKYAMGTDSAGVSAVTKGSSALVLGTTNSTTITATRSSLAMSRPRARQRQRWSRSRAVHRPRRRRSVRSRRT